MPIATPQGTLDFKSVDKVTFVGASSNTVIDTTTGSLGVGVGVGGPTSNLHVVGNTRLEGDINMLHTANTASIKLNSNVVTEFPRSKKLIKYPRVVLNSASQDGYVVTASTDGYVSTKFHRYDPFRPFVSGTGTNSANGWHTGPPDNSVANNWDQTFDTSGYNKDLTSYGVGGYAGTSIAGIESEWLKLELPHKIVLSHFYYQQRDGQSVNYNQAPRDFRILGSNNDVNWDTIQTFTDQTSFPEGKTLTAEASKGYKYLAFVVTKTWVTSGMSHLTLKNLEYYGIPEYDPEAYGMDVVVKSVPNVPNTDWLEVYFDAKGLPNGAVTNPISGLGGTTINGTATNVTVSDGAFVFDGSSTYITGGTPSISGNHHHSFSCWLKPTSANSGYRCIGYLFHSGSNNTTTGLFLNNNRPVFLTWGNNLISDHTLAQNEWVHVTAVYNGSSRTIYVNCKQIDSDTYSSYNINASATLLVGASTTTPGEVFGGSIANFRLFNRALTTDEIYQLYDYQKEYFGHSTNNMTLKAGRLGIGTSEPKAVLDVNGNIYGSGSIVQVSYKNTTANWNTSAAGTSGDMAQSQETPVKWHITPTKTTSKILVNFKFLAYFASMNSGVNGIRCQVWRKIGSTYTRVYGVAGIYHDLHFYADIQNHHVYIPISFVDTPETTSTVEYALRASLYNTPPTGGLLSIGNGNHQPVTMQLMEIGA